MIDYLRGRGPGFELLRVWVRSRRLRLTAITLYELRSGLDWDRRSGEIEALFMKGPLPFDRDAALEAGRVEANLRAAGRPIGVADTQQAGICLAINLPLATRNISHFERIENLRLFKL